MEGGEGLRRRRVVGFARCVCAVGEGGSRRLRGGALMGRPLPRLRKENKTAWQYVYCPALKAVDGGEGCVGGGVG